MNDADRLLIEKLRELPSKPGGAAKQADKKRYSELMSAAVASALSEALRRKGLHGTLPSAGAPTPSGSEIQDDEQEDLE